MNKDGEKREPAVQVSDPLAAKRKPPVLALVVALLALAAFAVGIYLLAGLAGPANQTEEGAKGVTEIPSYAATDEHLIELLDGLPLDEQKAIVNQQNSELLVSVLLFPVGLILIVAVLGIGLYLRKARGRKR